MHAQRRFPAWVLNPKAKMSDLHKGDILVSQSLFSPVRTGGTGEDGKGSKGSHVSPWTPSVLCSFGPALRRHCLTAAPDHTSGPHILGKGKKPSIEVNLCTRRNLSRRPREESQGKKKNQFAAWEADRSQESHLQRTSLGALY